MTTRPEFIAGLRLRLDNPEPLPNDDEGRWTLVEMNSYLDEAFAAYSKRRPRIREQEFTIETPAHRVELPEDAIGNKVHELIKVSPRYEEISPKTMRRFSSNRWYDVVDGELVFGFLPQEGETYRVRYAARWILPPTADPPEESEDAVFPPEHEDLIYLWAEYLAWRKIGGSDANLSRWTDDKKRDDSPLIPHYVFLERQWQKAMNDLQNQGRVLQRVRIEPRNRLRAH